MDPSISFYIIPSINLIIMILIFALSIYSMILFIKLARRGIKALDIYIDKNKSGGNDNTIL